MNFNKHKKYFILVDTNIVMNLESLIPKLNEIDVVIATVYLTLVIPLIIALIYSF